jgi:predicted DNA-binding protein
MSDNPFDTLQIDLGSPDQLQENPFEIDMRDPEADKRLQEEARLQAYLNDKEVTFNPFTGLVSGAKKRKDFSLADKIGGFKYNIAESTIGMVESIPSWIVDITDEVFSGVSKDGPIAKAVNFVRGNENFDPVKIADILAYTFDNIGLLNPGIRLAPKSFYDEESTKKLEEQKIKNYEKFKKGLQELHADVNDVDLSDKFIIDNLKKQEKRSQNMRYQGEGFIGGGFDDKVVATASAIVGVLQTAIPAFFTRGRSLKYQIGVPMFNDYNINKAKYLYGEDNPNALDLLAQNGEIDVITPGALGYISTALEKLQLTKIDDFIATKDFAGKAFVQLFKTGGVNGIQEGLQGLVESQNLRMAKGESATEAAKNIMTDDLFSEEFLEDFLMGMVGGSSVAVGGRSFNRALTRALKSDEGTRTTVNKYVNTLVELNTRLSQAKNDDTVKDIKAKIKQVEAEFVDFIDKNNKISDFLNEGQQNELLSLLKEKDADRVKLKNYQQDFVNGRLSKLEYDNLVKSVVDRQKNSDIRINEIKKEGNRVLIEKDLSTVRKAIKKITGLNIYDIGNTAQFLAELNKRRKAQGKREYTIEEAKDIDGVIIGKDILINLDVAANSGAITVGSHELLHAVLRSVINGEDGKITDKGRQLVKQFREELSAKELDAVEERLEEKYGLKRDADGNIDESNFDKYAEEYFTAYIDAALDDDITDSGVMKLAKYFHNVFKTEAKFNGEFKDGKDMKAFLKQYVSDVRKGEVGDVFVQLAQEGADIDTEATSRSEAVKSVNETENNLKKKLKEQGKEYTKTEFQSSSEFNSIFSSINLDGGAINNYIKSLGMTAAKRAKVIEEAGKRLLNYDPQAKRKTESGEEITIGEAIMANIGYAKKVAAKKLFEEGEDRRRTRAIEDKDADIADTTPTTQQTDVKDVKLRKLKDFNVELDNGLADALTIAEVNDILDNFNNGKITFEQAQKQLDAIVLKDIRASLSKIIPKISKGKPTPEYDAFIRREYDEIIQSLGIKTIRTSYKKFFTQEKTGVQDYKNIDPVTGKVSNYRKSTQVNTTNKREFIRYFLEAKGGVLNERRTALIRRIAKRKASLAVDSYIEQNSNNLEAVMAAKMRTMSDSAENATNEQVSLDSVRFSRSFFKKLDNIDGQMNKRRKTINGFNHYYKPPGWKEGDKVLTFSYNEKTGKYNKGYAYEQAFAETLKDIAKNIKDFVVELEVAGEEGGPLNAVADAVVSFLGVKENHEIKKGTLINNLNVKSKAFTLANTIHSAIKSRDGKTTLSQFIKNTVVKNLEQKVKEVNAEIDAYNKKYGYKKGDPEFAEQITGNVTKQSKGVKAFSETMPREVWDKVGKELGVLKTGIEVIQNHYNSKSSGEVKSISIFGFGSFRLDVTSIFKGLEMLDAATEVYTSLRYIKSVKRGSQEFVSFKPGLQFRLDGKPKNTPNSGLTTQESILDGLGNPPMFSKNTKKTMILNDAIVASRTTPKTKGITILDFDDTLATTKSLVKYTAPDGETGTLNAEEYARDYQRLLEQGYKFDFSEFNKVVGGKIAPLFQKALKLQGKFGPKNMFVLTARPPAAQKAIFDFLKANGLNIPLDNITGLGNSTSEAKALWIAEKVGEGFNDFYFADDALQNVQAVDNMLEQFDVKRKVQQARVKFSKTRSKVFNDIIEELTGIESQKRFARTKARKRGANKGKFRFFIPPSHEDFAGLLYNFMGKGKRGDAHRDFLEKALIRPLNRANRELDAARQAIANDYKFINKQLPDVKDMLTKKTPDGDFTYMDAVRVYLWDKHGHKIPGLSPIDQKNLVELVKSDQMLQAYADAINVISRQKEYVPPTDGWESGDIRMDLDDATGRVGREQFFAEFNEAADEIFSEENLNKIEAGYGKNLREAIEDMLYRIKTGRNRPSGQNGLVNTLMNFLNGAVGGVMFFNVRSSVLQQMSMVNYLNFADNNIFAAAKAFANQKQYWTDWAFIFNSDMLKQRRGGIQTDVNGAELAETISKSKYPIRTLIRKLLQLGFLPTQIGDNIAIATGGATYYRNRINKYLREGLSKKEAENKAFDDFQEITQKTQQSARPDMISQQQASPLGRLILAFQNVTSQFNRLGKKAAQDMYNRRITPPNSTLLQSDISNASRIAYYFAVQNLIFYSLQSALFAALFSDDEEDEEFFTKKKERMINGSIDSVLRGTGIYGAIASTVKNMAIKFAEQRGRTYNPDESAVMQEAFNLSPPLGIKARRIANAEKTLFYNRKVIDEMSFFDLDNPQWSAYTNYFQAFTNLPANRLYNKVQNLRQALNSENQAYQRLLMFLGWSQYNLGIDNKEVEEVKKQIKSKRKKKKTSLVSGSKIDL